MATLFQRLAWQETGSDDLLLARFSTDAIVNDTIVWDLSRQFLASRRDPIRPRLAVLELSGAYNQVSVTLDGVTRLFRHQGRYTLRLAGQLNLTLRARTRGAATAGLSITFYSSDLFAAYNSADVYFRDGSSGEPLSIVYNVSTYINGGQWKWHPSGNAPFNNDLSIELPVLLREENTARFDQLDPLAVNGRITTTVRGYCNGAANTLRTFDCCFGFDEQTRAAMFADNPLSDLVYSNYYWRASGFILRNQQSMQNPKAIASIGGRGAMYIAMRPPRDSVTNAFHPIGTNPALVAGTITIECY